MFGEFSKTLIFFGIVFILIGLAFSLFEKVPFIGRLPGDVLVRKGNFTFYAPIATSIIISAILTIVFNLISRR